MNLKRFWPSSSVSTSSDPSLKGPAGRTSDVVDDAFVLLAGGQLQAQANEAARCVQEKVLRSTADGNIGSIFGWGFALASPITIDRKAGTDAMQQIAVQGRERFRQGFWIVLYPEGTRIPVGTRAKYKTGGARLAVELGAPILPVAHNAGYLWPKGIFGKRPGTVTISIGKPIPPDGKDAQELIREVETWIETEVERLGVPK